MDLASSSCPSQCHIQTHSGSYCHQFPPPPQKTCIFTFQDILEGNLLGQLSKLLDNWGFLANRDDPFLVSIQDLHLSVVVWETWQLEQGYDCCCIMHGSSQDVSTSSDIC